MKMTINLHYFHTCVMKRDRHLYFFNKPKFFFGKLNSHLIKYCATKYKRTNLSHVKNFNLKHHIQIMINPGHLPRS